METRRWGPEFIGPLHHYCYCESIVFSSQHSRTDTAECRSRPVSPHQPVRMSDPRKPTANQLSTALPGPSAYLTGHDSKTAKAVIHASRPVEWHKYDEDKLGMSVAFTTSFPADLNGDADVKAHDEKMAAAGGKLGLVAGGGTVLRYVDFAPDYTCMMHRTQSVDYGILVEGEIESILDSGETVLMRRGDVMVQRATMHAWRNPSKTEWARMIFVLQDCKPLFVGGERFGEDLGRGTQGIPDSGNDK